MLLAVYRGEKSAVDWLKGKLEGALGVKIIALEHEETPGWIELEPEQCCREDEDGVLECDSDCCKAYINANFDRILQFLREVAVEPGLISILVVSPAPV